MSFSMGTVLAVSSRALIAACERSGLDADALLRSAGIRRQALDDPGLRLDADKVRVLWTLAYERSGDAALALRAAEACPFGAYKVIDFMAANAGTVGEAFRCGSRYFGLVNTGIRLPIDEAGDPVTFDVVGEGGSAGVPRPYAEYCLATFVLHVRAGTGLSFPVRGVTFAHRAPADGRAHERFFGCPVRFDAGRNRLSIDRACWEARAVAANPGVLQVLTEHAELLLRSLPRGPDLVERTRRAIAERLRAGDFSLESVARELGTSPRSLQRHLHELGSTFDALADEVRATSARMYLEESNLAVAEVACLLGFADQSTFHRAFKRWTGCTPARFRMQSSGAALRGAPGKVT